MSSLVFALVLSPVLAADPAETGAPAAQAAPAAAPAAQGALPPQVEELFKEKGKDGQPILTDSDRAAVTKLPSHILATVAKKIDAGTLGGANHLHILLSLDLSPQTAELVFSDNCVLCHSDPEAQGKSRLFSPDPKASGSPAHLNLKSMLSDAHFRHGLMCSGCHGGSPDDEVMGGAIKERWPAKDERQKDRGWVVGFCGKCHGDPSFMRGFNPSLPTDQVAKYKESQHGILLLQKHDSKAAQCVSCHGVHGIQGPKNRLSNVHPQQIPFTCGKCHADSQYMAGYTREDGSPLPTNQLELYQTSVHGKALLEKGDLGAPACNDCHGNHAAMPPQVASIAQVCRTCHAQNGILFDGSKHKKAYEAHKWPECGQCHGEHGIQKTSDLMISDSADGLCGNCHAKFAGNNTQCNQVARYFRGSIMELADGDAHLGGDIEHLAERGLDIEKLGAAKGELDEALVQARSRIHAFDQGEFDVAAKPGREALAKANTLVADAHSEYGFRRNGVLASIGIMGFLAVMLAFKVRELNARRKK